jgi:predicted Rossmann-fold nucleotide-binding protein
MNTKHPPSRPAICVFCGSAVGHDPAYRQAARRFGRLLVENGFRLGFGGGGIGLMGEVATGVAEREGEILGILPGFLRHLEPPMRAATKMFEVSEGFAVLPGGLGTLDEFFEAYTAAQLSQHAKPIVLINTKGYFDPLIALIEHFIEEGFVNAANKELIEIVATPEEAIKIFVASRPTA